MDTIDRRRADLLRLTSTLLAVPGRPAAFGIAGKGAADCLQGIFTNDVVKTPFGSLTYGAFLTAKGAIILDAWVVKLAERFLILADAGARDSAWQLLKKQLPPRLALATDLSEDLSVHWLVGPVGGVAPPNGHTEWPAPGQVQSVGDRHLGRGTATAPFSAVVIGPAGGGPPGNTPVGSWADLRTARVLAGFPTLGAEIEERTLPPEVGFDRLGGVSYSKGCYVGQETVARVHFRGHPNWQLRGVHGEGFDGNPERMRDGKPALRVTTVIRLDDGVSFGLGTVRREVETGTTLSEGGSPLRVLDLPLGLEATKR